MSDRARQKKLEKHRKNRLAVQKKARLAAIAPSDASLVRAATRWPVVGSWIGGDVWNEREPALVTAVVARAAADGRMVVGTALVDRTCLGIKDGFGRPTWEDDLDVTLDRLASGNGGLEPMPFDFVGSLVFQAVDYAARLGFSPHPDCPLELFGPRPEPLLDTPWCRAPRPIYIPGPRDDVRSVTARLDARISRAAYDFVSPFDEANDLDEARSGRSSGPADQMAAFVEPLLTDSDGSVEALEKACRLGMLFWNLALTDADDRAQALEAMLEELPSESHARAFRALADTMVARHNAMFSHLHLRRSDRPRLDVG